LENIALSSAATANSLHVSFDAWTGSRQVVTLGTNAGAEKLPFQTWHHFKEAFAPELVARAVNECARPVKRCVDPFGGSGTTALACQFLGVAPVTIEVNPYLADLIEAKLTTYDGDDLVRSLGHVVKRVYQVRSNIKRFDRLPPSFIQSSSNDRWVFDRLVAGRIAAYLDAIDTLDDASHRRLFRALLGGMLVQVSNIIVNGKGRRYRSNWQERSIPTTLIDQLFRDRAQKAIVEVHRYRHRHHRGYELRRGDCRSTLSGLKSIDLAVFSPPYPNSFDYTDVYNVELWMLGYLEGSADNRALRQSTLCSHVQIKREFLPAPTNSRTLAKSLRALNRVRDQLWSPWIPEMVGAYFHDMDKVLRDLMPCLTLGGEAWAVVGDSRYAGIQISTADILAELAPEIGFEVIKLEPFRSMRASAQQGGKAELDETLLVLRKTS
jgi:hypothetical protein